MPEIATSVDRILAEIEALSPAPFQRVLSRVMDSLTDADFATLPVRERAKIAREFAMLTGYATPAFVITNQHAHLHVEKLSDAQLLAEHHAMQAELARFLPCMPALGTTLAPAAEGDPGGLGLSPAEPVAVTGDPPAEKKGTGSHAIDMVVAALEEAAREPARPKPRAKAPPAKPAPAKQKKGKG